MPCTAFELHAAQASGADRNVRHLSILPERCGITTISADVLESTWKKAERLLNTTGSICKAPGMLEAMCVASDAGDKPHIVSKTKKGNLACDDVCLAWKSRRLCSHVLAVAEEWNCLNKFLSCYRRMRVLGNYTSVCIIINLKMLAKSQIVQGEKVHHRIRSPILTVMWILFCTILPKALA